MSALLERTRTKPANGSVLPMTLPQVNLLPPEVRAARDLRRTKRWLLISLVLTVALCVAAYGAALISSGAALAQLNDAQDETARLNDEAAQYSKVPMVLGAIDQAESARVIGMATDVRWREYVEAASAVLPEGVSIDDYSVTIPTPMSATAEPDLADLLFAGEIAMTLRTEAVPNTALWLDGFASVPGFFSPWISSATLNEDEDGIYYTVSATVTVTKAALSLDFEPTEGEG